jgi:hypothetical protein
MFYAKLILVVFLYVTISSCSKSGGLAPSALSSIAPNAPINLSATSGDSNVNLSWQTGSSDTSGTTYTLLRSLVTGSGYVAVASCSNLTALTCNDNTVINGTTYFYIVQAINAFGTSPNSNEVTATPSNASSPPGSFAYFNSSPTYTLSTAISNNNPIVNGGGAITSWAISPNLTTNTGLNFNTSTGVISGTPTSLSNPGVTYTVTASNANGTSTRNILITVAAGVVAPTISYTGTYTFQAGQVLSSPIVPTLGGGTPTSCTSLPALPTGLVLNPTTCVISGTPTATAAQQLFTITASNAGGNGSGTVNIGVLSSSPNNIAITGVANFTTSSCALFNLTVRDVFGNPSNISANTTFNLSGAGTNGAFYSDSTCTTTATNVVVPNANSNAVFYYRQTSPGSASLTATLLSPVSPALGSANRNVTVAISTPAKIGLIVPATGTTVSCNQVTVNVLDASNNSVNATSAMTVNLSGTGSPAFFSNSTCATGISSVSIASGANTATVYMRKTSPGSSTLTGAASGMASGTAVINISLGPVERIIFSSVAAVPFATSTCQAYTLQTRDSLNNNTVAVSADTTVALSGVSDGSFYSNSTCTSGNEITSTVITNGNSSRTIYYSKPTTTAIVPGANITLTASVVGWSPNATASVNVSSGNPINLTTNNSAVGLAVSTATNVTVANKCIGTTVRVLDELSSLVPTSRVVTPITANLSGGGSGAQFWSNATCTTSTSTVTVSAGANTGIFYYSSTTTTPTVAINWTNGGLSGTGGSRNVTVSSGVASQLTWTAAPSSFNTNTCQTYAFYVRDPNVVTAIGTNVSTATDFQLSDASDGIFFSTAGCSNPVTTVQVAAGAQTATFYYRKATVSAATLAVALQAPPTPAITTLNLGINVTSPALVPNNILITASPSTGLVATQSCSLLTLQSRNGSTPANVTSNSTFTLSGTNGASFFLDNGCTAAASPLTMTIASNTNSISGLYVRTANTGSVVISGTGPLTVNSLNLTYSAPAPTRLALSGPILMNAGLTCGSYNVKTQDGAGVDRNVLANTTISFASTGSVGVQFFSDSTCSTPLPSNQVTVNTGSNSANVFARGNTAGAAQIQVSATGLTTDSQSVTIQ